MAGFRTEAVTRGAPPARTPAKAPARRLVSAPRGTKRSYTDFVQELTGRT